MLALLLAASLTATFVDGSATVQGRPLHEGDEVHAGDTLETQKGARVEVTFPNGSLLRLGESSKLTVQGDAPESGRFSGKLLLGNVWAKVRKLLAANELFQVETENAVAGVRGTEFRVQAGAESLVRVYEGVVEVKGDGFTHRVEPGNELRVRKGEKPEGPRRFDAASEKDKFARWARTHDKEHERRLQERRERRRQ